MHFVTADPHFGWESIIEFCERPFRNAAHMDEFMLDRINTLVKKRGDTLWILGDFAKNDLEHFTKYRRAIHCKDVRLIEGNHDRHGENYKKLFTVFEWGKVIKACGARWTLCHYPIEAWPRGTYMLHGHTHGSMPTRRNDVVDGTWRQDVGVDVWNYEPVSLEVLLEKFQL